VDRRGRKIHVVHAQGDEFRRPEAVPVGEQDHREIPLSIPLALPGRAEEGTHLGGGEVVAEVPVRGHAASVPEEVGSSTPAAGQGGTL